MGLRYAKVIVSSIRAALLLLSILFFFSPSLSFALEPAVLPARSSTVNRRVGAQWLLAPRTRDIVHCVNSNPKRVQLQLSPRARKNGKSIKRLINTTAPRSGEVSYEITKAITEIGTRHGAVRVRIKQSKTQPNADLLCVTLS